ncbi:hypothetical protein DSM3645_29866 [Blastopirellula marina DSM 3645]|uniref:Uncharacterized protein n=1 Tax=Blastopirellula marina DSM 3645 TaxID=314230 RepID=A3ZXJ8_9BACT|nr:hypothetical protein DSM3645_29866 [Blastopirellula marina DSM 3645]
MLWLIMASAAVEIFCDRAVFGDGQSTRGPKSLLAFGREYISLAERSVLT